MIYNRDGHNVSLHTIDHVKVESDTVAITYDGHTFLLEKEELNGFVPQAGDPLVITTRNMSLVVGVIIDGRVIRHKTEAQVAQEHQQWRKNLRLERLEEYLKSGQALKEEAKNLHPALAARMQRFADEDGEEFWIESARYEMYAVKGADALLRKTEEMEPKSAIEWIKTWEKKDYSAQLEEVPDFGEGHSGNTFGFAVHLALAVLEGKSV